MGKKSGLFLLCGAVLLFCLYAVRISYPAGTSGFPEVQAVTEVRTYDSLKKPVTVSFSKIPERVIINRLNGAETLMALGAADRIIAVNMQNTDWGKPYDDRYMEQGKALEKITYRNLTKEEAVLLNPDCIIGWYSTFADKRLGTTDFWNARQVATYIQATSNMVKPGAGVEDECRFITDMGLIFHAESQAKLLTDEIWKEIEDVQEKTRYSHHPSVMVVEFSGGGLDVYGYEWLVGDMVRRLGGFIPCENGYISYEELIRLDPDVIFVVYFNHDLKTMMEQLTQNPAFSSLKAVREKRVYPLRLDYMYTTAVRTINGLRVLSSGMYPDLAGLKGNVNSAINKLRPQNTYTGVLTYESDKWDASLLCNYYTGLNREAYTDNRFLVFDLSGNYKVNEALSVFGTITNLTNESWENTYTAYLGMGAWPQPGRAFCSVRSISSDFVG